MNHKNNGYGSPRPSVALLYALTMLSTLMGAMISIVLDRVILPNPHIATVDMTGIIHQFVKAESMQSTSIAQHQAHIHAFSAQLETTLQEVAREKHVILVPKEAVIAGGVDLTPEVSKRLGQSDAV